MPDISLPSNTAEIINAMESQFSEDEVITFVSDLLDQISWHHREIRQNVIKRLGEDI